MHRTLYLAPITFVALLALGFPGLVGRLLEDGGRLVGTIKGPTALAPAPPIVAGAVLTLSSSTPTPENVPIAEATPTPPPATAILARPEGNRPPGALSQLLSGPGALIPTATAQFPTATPAPPTATPAPPTATPAPPTATPTAAVVGPIPQRVGSEPTPRVGAKEFIVVDGDSGAVLLEQNAHRHVSPASTTKIVTALVALQRNDPAEVVTASYDPSELIDSTLMGLRVGDRITLEDLLYGLMLPSGNDAALAIAAHVAGSRQRFVDLMTE
ncbi:MAG TPA: D-alanyl-D-alanine carboxypeptidase, partial [Chloroflexota bacterium]